MTVWVVQRIDNIEQTKELIAIFENKEDAMAFCRAKDCSWGMVPLFDDLFPWHQVEEWAIH